MNEKHIEFLHNLNVLYLIQTKQLDTIAAFQESTQMIFKAQEIIMNKGESNDPFNLS